MERGRRDMMFVSYGIHQGSLCEVRGRTRKRQSWRHVSERQYVRHMHHVQARVAGINSALGLGVC